MRPILLIMWTAFQSFILRDNNNNNNNNNNDNHNNNNNNNNNSDYNLGYTSPDRQRGQGNQARHSSHSLLIDMSIPNEKKTSIKAIEKLWKY